MVLKELFNINPSRNQKGPEQKIKSSAPGLSGFMEPPEADKASIFLGMPVRP
jgi:hypothetical protein